MRNFCRLTLGFLVLALVAPGSQANPTEQKSSVNFAQEYWHLFLSRLVLNQPGIVGPTKFLATFKIEENLKHQSDRIFFKKMHAQKNFPALTIEGDQLAIGAGDSKILIGLENAANLTLSLNGKTLAINPKEPLHLQVAEALKASTPSKNANSWNWLDPISVAHASELEQTYMGSMVTATGVVGAAWALTKTTGLIAAAAAAGGISAGVATVAGVAAGAAAVAGAAGCAAGTAAVQALARSQTSFRNGFYNCVSSPLSLVGLNPRDRLYLSKITCANGGPSINVELSSPSGIRIEREFHIRRATVALPHNLSHVVHVDRPHRVRLNTDENLPRFNNAESEEQTGRRPQRGALRRPANNAELDRAANLFQDFDYYYRLCLDPARVRAVQADLAQGNLGPRGFDSDSASELHRPAR